MQHAGGDVTRVDTLEKRAEREGDFFWTISTGGSSIGSWKQGKTGRTLRSSSTSPRAREDLSEEVRAFQLRAPFVLDQDTFLQCLRTAKRGAAGGSLRDDSGTSSVPFGESTRFFHFVPCGRGVGERPNEVIRMLRMGRMTALQKPRGGVRGMVAGDIVRRLVSRAMAKQLGEAFEQGTAHIQCALSTRAGCECVSHVLQGLTDLDDRATVMSIDGIGAYDSISRRAMLEGLRSVSNGVAVPFVHDISQGEGGEQGDALMPALFSLGQHNALVAVAAELHPTEKLFAFLDDIYVVCAPDRVATIYSALQNNLWWHARIRVNLGKTQL